MPTFVPPRVTERGLGGAPTLVQNVETLAHLALIARYGPRWFRALGTAREPGSMLTTVHQPRRQPRSSRPRSAPRCGPCWSTAGAQAVLVGGFHGTWLPAGSVGTLTLDNQALSQHGAAVGAGVIAALPADRCGLAEAARVTRYLAAESAGQCGPCLNGLPRMATALAELAWARAQSRRRQVRADLERWAGLVDRPRRLQPPGRYRPVRPQRADRIRAGDRPARARGQCSATNRTPFLPLPDGMPTDRRRLDLTMADTLRVNPINCTGHGVCAELLPELIAPGRVGLPDRRPAPGAPRRWTWRPAARWPPAPRWP